MDKAFYEREKKLYLSARIRLVKEEVKSQARLRELLHADVNAYGNLLDRVRWGCVYAVASIYAEGYSNMWFNILYRWKGCPQKTES